MNKGIKIVLTVAITATCVGVMAGPRHHHNHHRPNNGVRLATDIVNLVGAGLNVLTPRQTVVTTPVVVTTPTIIGTTTNIVTPIVTTRPTYYAPPPPPRPHRHHHRHNPPGAPRFGHRR